MRRGADGAWVGWHGAPDEHVQPFSHGGIDLALLTEARDWLTVEAGSRESRDLILLAERLRLASGALDRITGRAGVEEMLDALFGRFCIGK